MPFVKNVLSIPHVNRHFKVAALAQAAALNSNGDRALSCDVDITTALQLHKLGRSAEAEATYKKILTANPQDAQSTHLLGMLLFENGRGRESVAQLERSIDLDPANAQFMTNFAGVLASLGELRRAIGYARSRQ